MKVGIVKPSLSNNTGSEVGVGSALVPDDAGNILQVAVNRLLKGVKTKQVDSIFAAQNTMTASPLGSPTASSPEVTPAQTLDEWVARYRGLAAPKRINRSKSLPQTQMGMLL